MDPSDKPYKARFAAQMMAAATVLAETAPDDFRRRSLARPVFVYGHEFLRWARQAKNELKSKPSQRQRVARLEELLRALGERDWPSYEVIRHRIAAHRQPLAPDAIDDLQLGAEFWNDISSPALRILCEDARDIWNELAGGFSMPRLESFPPISPELSKAIDDRGYEPVPEGVAAGVGSFDLTRSDAVAAIQGGDLGQCLRQVVDAIRNIKLLSQLWLAVNGHEPYTYVLYSAIHVEICALHDLLFGGPSGSNEYGRPLIELLAADGGSPALPLLEAARQKVPQPAMDSVRHVRAKIGARVDDQMTHNDLLGLLRGADPNHLNATIDHLFSSVEVVARADVLLRPLLMFDVHLSGLSRVDVPIDAKPFEAASMAEEPGETGPRG